MEQSPGRSSQPDFDPSTVLHTRCAPTHFPPQGHENLFHCFKLEERDTRLAVFECDSQLASFAPRTELTLWKVRTEHASFDLATKVDEFVQLRIRLNFSDTVRFLQNILQFDSQCLSLVSCL